MADTLKASEQGLAIVDRARKRKGWTKTRTPVWWDAALTTQATLRRFWRRIAIQRESFIAICEAVGIRNWEAIAELEEVEEGNEDLSLSSQCSPSTPTDWGEAPDLTGFYGRVQELQQLEQWIARDRCKLVALLGMGGIGKTSLAVAFADQVEEQFDCIIWRSLLGAPPLLVLLARLIPSLSRGRETLQSDRVPDGISQLIGYLERQRCLIILDEVEAIIRSRDRLALRRRTQQYREGCEDYGELFKRVGSERHQSCLLVTSREKPEEIAAYEGETLPVRSLSLKGLPAAEAQTLLQAKGMAGDEGDRLGLIQLYGGNPLALNVVTTMVRDVFQGDLRQFLSQNTLVLGDRLRTLLAQQMSRLSGLEKEVLYWLVLEQEPASLSQLYADLLFPPARSDLLEALIALERRSLLDRITAASETLFSLQPFVVKYVTEELVEQILDEIDAVLDSQNLEQFKVLKTHALLLEHQCSQVYSPRLLQRITEGLQRMFQADNRTIASELSEILPLIEGQTASALGYIDNNLRIILKALGTGVNSSRPNL